MSETRLRIDSLGHRGDGVAETPDGPVYAAFALPGESAAGRREGDRLSVIRIETPSPVRVTPHCPHFGTCGGCALQHAADPFLADWKTALLRAALAARGLETEIRPIHVSPPGARRRATLAARRLKSGVALGFHGRAEAAIVPVSACPVMRPEIVSALPALADVAGLVGARRGEVRVAVAVSEAGLDVDLSGGKPLEPALAARLAAAAEAADLARLSVGGEPVATRRPPAQRFGPARVTPPPGAFLQATADGEAALWEGVSEAVGAARRVADLFCGAGTFALRLVERASVTAVEADRAALDALAAGWRAAGGLRPLTAEARDLFRRPLSPADLAGFDAVVMDPPRAGAAAQTAALAASAVRRVAAVSCNPSTFARDARTLVDGGYRLLWARPVDQFRWSPHLEIVAAFARP